MTTLHVLDPGPLSTVQDLGRPGHAHLGVSPSGAADADALRLANRLVGNPESAAGVETTLGGLAVRADRAVTVALCGALCPATVEAGGAGPRPLPPNCPVALPAGAVLRVGIATRGLRGYLAVRGGVAVPAVLGSRATDLLAGLGPAPLRAGDTLPVGGQPAEWPAAEVAPVRPPAEEPVLRFLPGPRQDWVTPAALDRLSAAAWQVRPDSDRVGLRLSGPRLDRAVDAELPSEGLVAGAVQVPPDGQPVLFLADHPVTGGYPVVAVVVRADLGAAAQVRPGGTVRLRAGP